MQTILCAISLELRSRGLWTLTLLAIGLTTTLIGISPLGISAQTNHARLLVETGFLGGMAGCSLAAVHLARIRIPLRRTSALRRLGFEFGAIATASTLAALGAILPLAVTNASNVPVLTICLMLAHLTAIGLIFAGLQLKPITAGLFLPLIVWSAQAFLGPNDPRILVRVLRTTLDPTRNSTIVSYAESLSYPLLAAIFPIIGLLGLRAALDSLNRIPNKQ